jgi:hypothetical protein
MMSTISVMALSVFGAAPSCKVMRVTWPNSVMTTRPAGARDGWKILQPDGSAIGVSDMPDRA